MIDRKPKISSIPLDEAIAEDRYNALAMTEPIDWDRPCPVCLEPKPNVYDDDLTLGVGQ